MGPGTAGCRHRPIAGDTELAEAIKVLARITAALRRGGRRRYLAQRTEEIHTALRSEQLEQPPLVADAFGAGLIALVGVLTASIQATSTLEQELEASCGRHPAAELIRSQPGLAVVLGARVLAEFGDDPARDVDAQARRNYAGTSPITQASGKSHVVLARHKTNKRLRAAGDDHDHDHD